MYNDTQYQVTLSELYDAYTNCVRNKRNSSMALAFSVNLEDNLLLLRDKINDRSYELSPAVVFVVDKPVKREIFAADFRDRVVQHLIMGWLIPNFESEFIYDSYACRQDRGTLFGIRRLRRFIAKSSINYTGDCYVLKCDIQGFFMNIDRGILWSKLSKFVETIDFGDEINYHRDLDLFGIYKKDEVVSPKKGLLLWLLKKLSLCDPTLNCRINGNLNLWDDLPSNKSIFGTNGKVMPNGRCCVVESNKVNKPKGIPIGNLTSQWFANFYLNAFDHYMKSELKIKHYGRYVDDFFVVDTDRDYLKGLIPKISGYLKSELGLNLHPKKISICDYKYGVSFLGVTLKGGVILTGDRTKSNAKRLVYDANVTSSSVILSEVELRKFVVSINSYLGLMKHQSSYKLRRSLVNSISCQISNRTSVGSGCSKLTIKDYVIAGSEMLPYFEY